MGVRGWAVAELTDYGDIDRAKDDSEQSPAACWSFGSTGNDSDNDVHNLQIVRLIAAVGRTTRDAEQFSGPLQRVKAYQRIMTLTCWRVVELHATCSSEFLLTCEVRYRTLGWRQLFRRSASSRCVRTMGFSWPAEAIRGATWSSSWRSTPVRSFRFVRRMIVLATLSQSRRAVDGVRSSSWGTAVDAQSGAEGSQPS